MSEQAFISIGSNIEPERYVPMSVRQLAGVGAVCAVSTVYQSPAVGPGPQPDYLNAAVLVRTSIDPVDLRARLRELESALGRLRTPDKYAPRTVDLDLCLYGAVVLDGPGWAIPSPEILERAYLAVTLAELAPDFLHPVTGEPLSAIAGRLRAGVPLKARPDVILPTPS